MRDLLLRALLFLYPRDTRKRFGSEMLDMWRWRCTHRRQPPLRFWMSTLWESLRAAATTHMTVWAERVGRRPAPPPPRSRDRSIRADRGRNSPMGGIIRDVRHGARTLLRNPGFTVTATLVLAIGIGANTAVYSLLHTVLIQPLPFPESDRLMIIESMATDRDVAAMPLSYADLKDMDDLNRAFSGITGTWHSNFTFTGDGQPERIPGSLVTANFTEVMGVDPILGRGFRPEEESPDANRVILISALLWLTRYGGDPDIVGSVVNVGGVPSTIVGVMPPHFHFPENTSVWAPFQAPRNAARDNRFATVVGRLAPGFTLEAAALDVERVASMLAESHPSTNRGVGARVLGFQAWVFGEEVRPVTVFYGVVSLILVLACANVAGLLLARNEARRREVVVRACLGAGRWRITRQLLIEGFLLAGLGGALGVVVGWFSRELILILMAGDVPPFFMSGIEPGALLPIAVIILFSGLLFGLAPALNLARTDLRGVLQSTNVRLGRSRGGIGVRSLLVSAEVALALTVLTGANLMLKSVLHQRAVDPGFDAEGIATVFVTLPDAEWQKSDRIAFFRETLEKVRSLPGVDGAALASDLPTGTTTGRVPLWVGGEQLPGSGPIPRYRSTVCGHGYFATLGIPLIAGREFDARDGPDNASPVLIVNESFARRHWPGENAVGKRVALPEGRLLEARWHEVVGVVGDVHNAGFGRPPEPAIYLPMERMLMFDEFILVKVQGDPRRILGQLREAIWDVSDDVPLSQLRTLQQEIIRVNWQVATFSWAFGIISLIGLILAATGVYGIMAYSVSLRSREYALRMAVGAGARDLTMGVLYDGLTLVGGGVATGVALSLVGMQLLRDLLFRVSPIDMGAYGLSVGMVIAVALLASYLPARRATRLDPMRILGRG